MRWLSILWWLYCIYRMPSLHIEASTATPPTKHTTTPPSSRGGGHAKSKGKGKDATPNEEVRIPSIYRESHNEKRK